MGVHVLVGPWAYNYVGVQIFYGCTMYAHGRTGRTWVYKGVHGGNIAGALLFIKKYEQSYNIIRNDQIFYTYKDY